MAKRLRTQLRHGAILALAPHHTAREVAELLGVSQSLVYQVVRRNGTGTILAGKRGRPRGVPNKSTALSRRDREELWQLLEGRTYQEVADMLGVSRQRVGQIARENPGFQSRQGRWPKIAYQRFGRAVARAAQLEQRFQEHGTLRRYRGDMKEFPPCHCEACREANKKYTYRTIGYTPKFGQEAYQAYVARHGIPHSGPLTSLNEEESE